MYSARSIDAMPCDATWFWKRDNDDNNSNIIIIPTILSDSTIQRSHTTWTALTRAYIDEIRSRDTIKQQRYNDGDLTQTIPMTTDV